MGAWRDAGVSTGGMQRGMGDREGSWGCREGCKVERWVLCEFRVHGSTEGLQEEHKVQGWVQEGMWGAGMSAAVQGWMQKGQGAGRCRDRAWTECKWVLRCRRGAGECKSAGIGAWRGFMGVQQSPGYRRGTVGCREGLLSARWSSGSREGIQGEGGLPHAWKECMDGVKSAKWMQR